MKKIKKPFWIAILVISVIVLAVGIYFLVQYFCQKDIGGDLLPTSATADQTATVAPTEAPTEKPTHTTWDYDMADRDMEDPDFDELMKINPDIYAWIYIPNTMVDYPVAQSSGDEDDNFYLEHNVYKQYQFSGTIYSEKQNSRDFHDRVTVLYGHNMLNGTMFASLHNFEDPDFFEQNNTVFITTKDKVLTYLVYSAYTYDDRHILNSFYMEDNDIFREYLHSTMDPHTYNGNVRDRVELNMDDHILTLSTCTSGPSDTRFLVQGVLVDERDR